MDNTKLMEELIINNQTENLAELGFKVDLFESSMYPPAIEVWIDGVHTDTVRDDQELIMLLHGFTLGVKALRGRIMDRLFKGDL